MRVKKDHLEASKFVSKPLMPKKSELSNSKNYNQKIPIFKGPNSGKILSKFQICFGCRGKGHSLKDCRNVKETQVICYHCGSDEHITKNCPSPGKSHLSSKCPQNTKGLYPNGGSCKFCGSVNHLSRSCKPIQDRELLTTVGKMDSNQGGDDDDVFLALKKIQDDKLALRASRAAQKPAQTKKVVFF
ncbi:hypothetical protein BB559_006004 [Furculomyces boomerangus]|uniref:CCHC-type domain-containing protein n=2 Tax=Harpellales TaxID=61421 RepID=A0A2T9Y1D0_9FUNG|nr:hypothetical protein BB559_006644 [Furculomyces boomerangus]PVU87510.1 hypothetical protein BB559_006004 [Furculomyces boomerangus]PWA00391.1 hypothetical protein BB558_003544 [Smittium angustum]